MFGGNFLLEEKLRIEGKKKRGNEKKEKNKKKKKKKRKKLEWICVLCGVL